MQSIEMVDFYFSDGRLWKSPRVNRRIKAHLSLFDTMTPPSASVINNSDLI